MNQPLKHAIKWFCIKELPPLLPSLRGKKYWVKIHSIFFHVHLFFLRQCLAKLVWCHYPTPFWVWIDLWNQRDFENSNLITSSLPFEKQDGEIDCPWYWLIVKSIIYYFFFLVFISFISFIFFDFVIRYSSLRLWGGYFFCFKVTPVFFYWMFLMDVQLKK